ncbi:MAG: GPR endopeptidase [Oscillospiraceae bacterium]|nr:GPR endopeptidase [Oscillospiraceae bacterium]
MAFMGRTDLACESPHLSQFRKMREKGIIADSGSLDGLELFSVEIISDEGAEILGKPIGSYYTLSLSAALPLSSDSLNTSVGAIAKLIKKCAPDYDRDKTVLIAALGNPDITPDAIGPLTASNILVTAHLKKRGIEGFENFSSTMLCRTGVLGTTGVESAQQIKCLCEWIRPGLVIAVDALAGTDVNRLCRSVQICDSGISPGSGVGNDREELSRESLGVPVIALGVPTVIDASALSQQEGVEHMFVTPRDIDSLVRSAGRILGYGINMALHPGLSIEDMEMLVG